MFRSVRARLIASYAAIIFLCLFLAGSAFVLLLREYQSHLKLDHLGNLAFAITYQVRLLEGVGANPTQIREFMQDQAEETGVRILLADRGGRVILDTGESLLGAEVNLPPRQPSGGRPFTWQVFYTRNREGLLFVLSVPRLASVSEPARLLPSKYNVILAVPEGDVTAAWQALAPILLIAGGIAMVVSTVAAFFISRSISRPIAQITAASEAMARGRYDQFIAVKSRDEVGRLAAAFNAMAQQVALSHRTLRDFLANVSHELKTPLTSVQGFSQAMLDGALRTPADFQSAAGIINQESNRMRRLVEDLLFLSKLESGQIGMRHELIDLDELLRDTVGRFEWQAEQNSQQLRLQSEGVPTIRGDAHWLGQVFTNLLQNALAHTPAGGTITVAARPAAGAGIGVVVHNTGSFIPPEELPRIFERFYQVDKSRARAGEGSGLGLAIVKEVVQAHGGQVTARSDATAGTTLEVWLSASGRPTPARQAVSV